MSVTKSKKYLLCVIFFSLFLTQCLCAAEKIEVKLQFSEQAVKQAKEDVISPYIYGMATYMREERKNSNVWNLNPTHFRFGGNTSTVFNWKINSWNTGNDWFYSNFKSKIPNMVDFFLNENVKAGMASSVTLPIMGLVAKDSECFSYPVSIYGRQNSVFKERGNGIDGKGKMIKADPNRCYTKIGADFVAEWVSHLKTKFGEHPHMYILDNEPMLWWKTHYDAHPNPTTYDEYWDKYVTTAYAVRKADPKAIIVGPALWGWLAMEYSSMDMPSEWNEWTKGTDRKKHGDVPFLEWFLNKVKDEEKKHGVSLLDVLDVHYYPEGEVRESKLDTDKNRQIRIEATRSMWDRSYKDRSWIKEKIYLIPRLKELAAKVKPELKVALGEYNFRAEKDVAGGIAQAELLGIFGLHGLYMANYWTIPPENTPPSFAFKMFRNYDGAKSTFGNVLVHNSYEIQDEGSVFSAVHRDKRILTIMVINKKVDRELNYEVAVPASIQGKIKTAKLYSYERDNLSSINSLILSSQKVYFIKTKPLSMYLLELKY